jgi:hypothetical protein
VSLRAGVMLKLFPPLDRHTSNLPYHSGEQTSAIDDTRLRVGRAEQESISGVSEMRRPVVHRRSGQELIAIVLIYVLVLVSLAGIWYLLGL